MDLGGGKRRQLFERLLEPHLDRLYRFAYRLTHSRAEAEDLFQDVLGKLYERLEQIEGLEKPAPWLCRVMYNQFVDDRRRYARRRLVDVSEDRLPGQSIESLGDDRHAPEKSAELDALQRALAALSEEHRSLVLLHDAEGYRLQEIAAITGSPIGTVKSRLHRARRRLREILETEGTFGPSPSCRKTGAR